MAGLPSKLSSLFSPSSTLQLTGNNNCYVSSWQRQKSNNTTFRTNNNKKNINRLKKVYANNTNVDNINNNHKNSSINNRKNNKYKYNDIITNLIFSDFQFFGSSNHHDHPDHHHHNDEELQQMDDTFKHTNNNAFEDDGNDDDEFVIALLKLWSYCSHCTKRRIFESICWLDCDVITEDEYETEDKVEVDQKQADNFCSVNGKIRRTLSKLTIRTKRNLALDTSVLLLPLQLGIVKQFVLCRVPLDSFRWNGVWKDQPYHHHHHDHNHHHDHDHNQQQQGQDDIEVTKKYEANHGEEEEEVFSSSLTELWLENCNVISIDAVINLLGFCLNNNHHFNISNKTNMKSPSSSSCRYSFYHPSSSSSDDTRATASSCFFSSSCHLKSLHIRNCYFDDDESKAITIFANQLKSNISLRKLDLYWSNLQDDSIQQIISSLWYHPSIQELDLTGNCCRQLSMEAIYKLLLPIEQRLKDNKNTRSNKPWLLDYNNSKDHSKNNNENNYDTVSTLCCDETNTNNIAATITSKLQRLYLREQCVEKEDTFDIRPLTVALSYNSTLLELDLSVNKLDDHDIEYIANAISTANATAATTLTTNTPALQVLDLRSNRISNFGIKLLAKSLMNHQTTDGTIQSPKLRTLRLQDNPFGEIGALSILDTLKVNFQLEYVGLSEHFTSCSDMILYYTALNWGGRRLLLSQQQKEQRQQQQIVNITNAPTDTDNNIIYDSNVTVSSGLWPFVLARASKCDGMDRVANILYYLLREGPVLLHR